MTKLLPCSHLKGLCFPILAGVSSCPSYTQSFTCLCKTRHDRHAPQILETRALGDARVTATVHLAGAAEGTSLAENSPHEKRGKTHSTLFPKPSQRGVEYCGCETLAGQSEDASGSPRDAPRARFGNDCSPAGGGGPPTPPGRLGQACWETRRALQGPGAGTHL